MLPRRAQWCLVCMLLAARLGAQQYDLRTWSVEHGLPGSTVNAICEDRQGYLWVGTNEGLARTDGIRFHVIGRDDGLPSDDITALHCTREGQIWSGCRDGTLVVVLGLDPFIVHPGTHRPARIEAIEEDGEGTLWIAATNGIWTYRHNTLEKVVLPGLPRSIIRDMVLDPRQRPLAATDSGLFVLQGGEWQAVRPRSHERLNVLSLHADPAGVIVGTTTGHIELDRHLRPLPIEQRITGAFPITLPDTRVMAVLRSREGDLWLGTPSGLSHISRKGGIPMHRRIGESNGLGHDLVRCLHQDRSGAIWTGTAFGGLSRFMSDVFMHFTDRDGLRSRIVSAIHRTPDGTLWLATVGGGVAAWDGVSLNSYGASHGSSDPYVLALGEDPEGHLLAGTATAGILRWNGTLFEPVPGLDPGGRVQVIQRDPYQRVWVGSDRGVLVSDHGIIHRFPLEGTVMDLEFAEDTMWIGTSAGVHYSTRDNMTPRHHPHLPRLPIYAMARDQQRNLWLGTDGKGLWRVNGSRLDSITTGTNSMGSGLTIASDAVLSVVLDAYENVWAGTRKGVHQLELDVMQEMVLDIRHYGAEDGFNGIETFRNAAMLDQDSTLWFGTVRGATRYDHRAERPLREEPVVHLTSMQLFFEDVDWGRWSDRVTGEGIPIGLELPHNRNHITFNFTGISLAYPERVRYRYILEGYDPDWSPITTTDRVTYSNLPPGEHTFKVLSRNASGVWTESPLIYRFTVVAPIWQRGWAIAAAAAIIVLTIIGAIRFRDRRARLARERLEAMVKARTHELAQEKQRSDELLLNILPRSTAEELKRQGVAQTRLYDNCTVLFSDFTGFTSLSGELDGRALVTDLDHFFRTFDRITDEFGIEKIKTIGDAYMCASGIPEPKPTHALDAVLTAFSMLLAMERNNAERKAQGRHEWHIRIGMHSGPIVAGVVGEKKFAYDIWGDTVNLASRMESNGLPGKVNISGATYAQVMEYVEVVPRGPIKVRGKGETQMYFAQRLRPAFSADGHGLVPNERLLRIRQEMLTMQEI